ncbi:PREDICTED: regulator of G-protein signaling protein-like, partial [Merops nubicus]|uniref:regulator of G-protein signaling protein-like n=1 Tax=Merops nubicus TaxID=57421 RepID=UPI0004F0A15E
MTAIATIASTDLVLLLRDDVFVDFFNTFLNLPVFGQTPIYISSMGRWDLWPELPSHLVRKCSFCKSSLCLHLVLCQKLLAFIRSGEAGEELTNFWLTTERLLGLDESDTRQRDLYLSLLHRLKATHLCEGSSVITLCRAIIGSLPKARHVPPISTRREILRKMQEQALFVIQSYWLPKFFIHCKMHMEEEKLCQPLLQEYQEHFLQIPSLKKPIETLSFLPWALSAETCAGRPFRNFLKCQDLSMETHLLDLWHDLEEFLPVVLDPSRENSFFLRHLIGEKICKTYLQEGTTPQLPLETRTLRSLRNHLMSGEFSPWIFRAQKEICKVLCCFYEEFLADDDRTFLQFMSPQSDVPMPKMQGHAGGKDKRFLLSQRINASLKLSQALHGTRNLEALSAKHVQLIATRDLRKGGSIQAEVELLLCKTAVENMNKKKTTVPLRKTKSSTTTVVVEKPSRRPRHFIKVLHNTDHLQYFKKFLEERDADKPLHFWIAMEKLVTETNPKTKSFLVNSIVRNFFHGEIPAEEQLDCQAPIIKEISEAKAVSPFMLITAQIFVQKAMEKRWFKEYQSLFPPSDTPKSNLRLRHGMENFKTDNLQWAWYAIHDIVRSLCKFRREMNNDKCRLEFEDFLRRELGNEEETSARTPPDKEVGLVRRHLFNGQPITVNFLVDDLRFYLEMDRLADSVEALAACNMQSKQEVAFLKKKAAIISKLFLNSDIPPKLRVNISEEERDLIWSLSSKGILNRVLYHRAKVIIFPILMHFWRRFCTWKVMRSFRVSTKDRVPISLPSTKTFPKSSVIRCP